MYDELEMFAPERDPRSGNPWLEHVAVTRREEIRYAEQLRLRIRESYLDRIRFAEQLRLRITTKARAASLPRRALESTAR